ncbi:MAG: hypothetical protein AAF518_06680 [Spirochaetota bacterium]
MQNIKLALKNQLALKESKAVETEWKRISQLSAEQGLFILFELYPETMLPKEFLNFRFVLNQSEASHIDRYYVYTLEANSHTTRRPSPFIYGWYNYTPFQGVYSIVDYTPDIQLSGQHCYKFLLQFQQIKKLQKGDRLKITSPHGNEIVFEYKQ